MSLKNIMLSLALIAAPVAAQAVSIQVDNVAASSGDSFALAPFQVSQIEIFGNDSDGAGEIVINYTATSGLRDLMVTASLNENPLDQLTLGSGFIDAEFEIRTGADGNNDGLLDIVTGPAVQPAVSSGTPLFHLGVIPVGTDFQIVARFSDVVGDSQNYDLRISAVPLPAPLALLLAGIGGLGLMARRRA
ncbi:MAG: hypothetical protein AAF317_05970 [Pseudomonadota bacterium]